MGNLMVKITSDISQGEAAKEIQGSSYLIMEESSIMAKIVELEHEYISNLSLCESLISLKNKMQVIK